MELLRQLAENKILITALLAWLIAQSAKVLLTLIVDRRLDLSRLTGLGGMPSSHSAVVCALTTAIGLREGFGSTLFALSCVLSLITMTDAAGVRRAAGQHAAMINRIVRDIVKHGGDLPGEALRELLGHTPFQVAVGALIGVLTAVIALGR